MAILVDGFIVSSAALVAARHDPQIRDQYVVCSSLRRARPCSDSRIIRRLSPDRCRHEAGRGEWRPWASLPLIQASVALHNQMATFEEASVPDKVEWMPEWLRAFRASFTFLTRIPVGGFPYPPKTWEWISIWFPLVGALIGLLQVLVVGWDWTAIRTPPGQSLSSPWAFW